MHADDDQVVEPPGLDGNLRQIVAERRQSDCLHREAVAQMGNNADARATLDGSRCGRAGIRLRWRRFLEGGLGG